MACMACTPHVDWRYSTCRITRARGVEQSSIRWGWATGAGHLRAGGRRNNRSELRIRVLHPHQEQECAQWHAHLVANVARDMGGAITEHACKLHACRRLFTAQPKGLSGQISPLVNGDGGADKARRAEQSQKRALR
eukprot:scaffold39735_cov264-Isochrysis_galbana.AAC.4